MSSPGGGLTRPEAVIEGGSTKLETSVLSFWVPRCAIQRLVQFSTPLLGGNASFDSANLAYTFSHCTIDSSAAVSLPSHIPVYQAVSALLLSFPGLRNKAVSPNAEFAKCSSIVSFPSCKVGSVIIFMSEKTIQ